MPNNKNEKVKTKKIKKGFFYLKILNKLLVVGIIVGGLYYLVCINNLSLKGFDLKDRRVSLNRINQENEELQLRIMALESYSSLNEKIMNLKLVKTEKVSYLNGADNLAKK